MPRESQANLDLEPSGGEAQAASSSFFRGLPWTPKNLSYDSFTEKSLKSWGIWGLN